MQTTYYLQFNLTRLVTYAKIFYIKAKKEKIMSEERNAAVTEEKTNASHLKGRRIFKIITASFLVILANAIFFFMLWMLKSYDDVQFDQILYQIKSPIEGTSDDLVGETLRDTVLVGAIAGVLEIIIYIILAGALKDKLLKFKLYVRYCATRVASFLKKRYMSMASLLLLASVLIFIFRLQVHVFIANSVTTSDFIEDNYVDPDEVEISFPKEKRNLIYIFLESMENTFADEAHGGNMDNDYIPELSALREENVSFSSNGGSYGSYSYIGTSWTASAMFSQTAGVPIKVPLNFDTYGIDGDFMPGITTLGDILSEEGYSQSLLLGSDATFAARDTYFEEHGKFHIIDIVSLKADGKLPEDYWEWWGVEDAKLFDFAKEEITRLASEGDPFNFMTLTTDTHSPDGYLCDNCVEKYEDRYANVLACSSKQLADFVDWIKEQPFYPNTTIILSGDHLTMAPEFLKNIDENYVRTTYNCIINAPIEPINETDREFGAFDMFPTTLAAIGATIEGNRLGIGTNLFSAEKTLTEIYGFEKVNEELSMRSVFYNDNFYGEKAEKRSNTDGDE